MGGWHRHRARRQEKAEEGGLKRQVESHRVQVRGQGTSAQRPEQEERTPSILGGINCKEEFPASESCEIAT